MKKPKEVDLDVLLGTPKPDEDKAKPDEDMTPDEHASAMKDATQEVMDALKADDVDRFGQALQALLDLRDNAPEPPEEDLEGDDSDDDEDDDDLKL